MFDHLLAPKIYKPALLRDRGALVEVCLEPFHVSEFDLVLVVEVLIAFLGLLNVLHYFVE